MADVAGPAVGAPNASFVTRETLKVSGGYPLSFWAGLAAISCGQPWPMATDDAGSVDAADFPEEGGPGDTLNAEESTDSDELRNDDGDVVVDPPEDWSGADKFGMTAREEREGESLDARLAAEQPDVTELAATGPVPDDETGRAHRGQVDGAPEDGDSLYQVVDE